MGAWARQTYSIIEIAESWREDVMREKASLVLWVCLSSLVPRRKNQGNGFMEQLRGVGCASSRAEAAKNLQNARSLYKPDTEPIAWDGLRNSE